MFHRKKAVASEPTHPSIERARQVANLLDNAFTIPIIRKKIGIDPLLGLLPVVGDISGAILGLYLVYVAYEVGLPGHILVRMGAVIIADILLGMAPIVGDLADFFWKSNRYNLKLLEEAYKQYGGHDRGTSSTGVYNTVEIQAEPVTRKIRWNERFSSS